MNRQLIALIFFLTVCHNVMAESRFKGIYFFTSIGESDFSDMTTSSDLSQAESQLLTSLNNRFQQENPEAALPQYSTQLSAQQKSTSISFGLGYIFHELISLEASYQYMGRVKISGPVVDEEDNRAEYSATGLVAGFDVRTYLHTPSYKGFGAFINWGATLWSRETRTRYEFNNETRAEILKDNGLEVVFGYGIRYFSQSGFGSSIIWEQYNIGQENLDVIKATLLYDFNIPH